MFLFPLLHDIWSTMAARKSMKNYSQITFEFQEPTELEEQAGVGVRIKSLKQPPGVAGATETEPVNEETPDTTENSGTEQLTDEPVPISDVELSVSEPDSTMILDFTTPSPLPENEVETDPLASVPKSAKSNRGRKSLKTIEEGAALINIPPDEELFKKQYYAIGEVAEMFQVNQSLLRFWETEFDIIQPRKNRKGDRHFRPIDIKNLLLIHDLLRRRKLTIEGAKDFLKKNKRSPERFAMIQSLQKIKGFLLEVKASL